jgi:hypothetical protein
MATTINLGKDYTISGAISNVSDLTVTIAGEKLEATTRGGGTAPIKRFEIGLGKFTAECTVKALAETTFAVGALVTVSLNGDSRSLLIVKAPRTEPRDGQVEYKLTLTPGVASAHTVTV